MGSSEYTVEFFISILFHHFSYNRNWRRGIKIIYGKSKRKLKEFGHYWNFGLNDCFFPIVSFKLLLESLEANHLTMLLTHLLLEHRIILLRTEYKDNAILIESLLQLLLPL